MHMIWHYHECIQFNEREMIRDVLQTTPGHFAGIVQPHFTVYHMTEQARAIPCADRHEIRAVPLHETDGTATVFV